MFIRKIKFKVGIVTYSSKQSSLTHVSNMSSARSFLRVGLMTRKKVWELPGCCLKNHRREYKYKLGGVCTITFFYTFSLPSVLSYEFHQFLLRVWLSRDGDRLLHEGLIEVHLIHFKCQLLGHLKHQRELTQEKMAALWEFSVNAMLLTDFSNVAKNLM